MAFGQRRERPPEGASSRRVVHAVCATSAEAAEHVAQLREQGRHPRTYDRVVRAEDLTARVVVVVADEE